MSEQREYLFIQVAGGDADPLARQLAADLEEAGATVTGMPLAGNYEAILDRLAAGAVPVVLKP